MAKVKELETQAALEQVKKEKAATEQQRRLSEERLVQFEQEKAQREAAEFVKLVADAKTFINSGDNQLALKKLRRANKLLPNDPEVVRLIKQCETKN